MLTIYIDLDGTAAKWNTEATIEDLKKPGYFRNLEPTIISKFADQLAVKRHDIFILSAYMPDTDALNEKKEWCREHIPNLPENHCLFLPCGVDKASFVEDLLNRSLTDTDILIDDHTPHLLSWKNKGGRAAKWLNGINGINGVFDGFRTKSLDELYLYIFGGKITT